MTIQRLPHEPLYAVCDDALDDTGYVLALDTSTGHVKKATSSDVPFGVNIVSTKNPITNEAETDVEVSVVPVRSGYIVKVKKEASAISAGDYVAVGSEAGKVAKMTIDTTDAGTLLDSLKKIVGIALEDAAADEDTVLVRLVGI
ncbi:MAG: hypothetical protein DRN14_04605 [Thermoplasmata archaeon]|nr:MAG: hypothetical protein DRN14_04605 [Thermoplasmata archaeon]